MNANDVRRYSRALAAAFIAFAMITPPAVLLPLMSLNLGTAYLIAAVLLISLPIVLTFDHFFMKAVSRLRHRAAQNKWFAIDDGKLKVGDILASRNSGKSSRLIRRVTGGDFSHVALYLGDGLIIEAVPPRVRVGRIPLEIMSDPGEVKILRSRKALPKIKKLRDKAYRYSFDLYSFGKAASFAFAPLGILAASDAVICSELVVLLYRAGGIELFRSLDRPSPGEICNSKKLRDVSDNSIREIPDEELNDALWGVAYETLSILQFLKRIGVWILAGVYSVSPFRSALVKPVEAWNFSENLWFFAWSSSFIFGQALKIFLGGLIFILLTLNRLRLAGASVGKRRRRLVQSRKIAVALLSLDRRAIAEVGAYPRSWRWAYRMLLRLGQSLRQVEIKILSRSIDLIRT